MNAEEAKEVRQAEPKPNQPRTQHTLRSQRPSLDPKTIQPISDRTDLTLQTLQQQICEAEEINPLSERVIPADELERLKHELLPSARCYLETVAFGR